MVPKAYLRGFCIDETEKTYLFDKEKTNVTPKKPTHINNIMNKRNAFTFKKANGERYEELEIYFRQFEEKWPSLKKNFIENQGELEGEHRVWFAGFISQMFLRPEKYRKNLFANFQQSNHKAYKVLFDLALSSIRKTKEKKINVNSFGEFTEAELVKICSSFNIPLEIIFDERYTIRMMCAADGIAGLITQMFWHLIEANDDQFFITGDNPVLLIPTNHINLPFGFGSNHIEVYMPLNSKCCWLGCWGVNKYPSQHFKLTNKGVDIINSAVIDNAERWIVSSKNDNNITDLVNHFGQIKKEGTLKIRDGIEIKFSREN